MAGQGALPPGRRISDPDISERHVEGTLVLNRIGYYTLAFLAVAISLVSMRFLTFDPGVLAEELRANLLGNPLLFFLHTTVSPIALLIGVFQFLPATRRTAWHRWSGRAYVLFCMLGAASGLGIAFTTTMGPLVGTGFAILAVLWFAATYNAYRFARNRDFARHRRWMIRSYALTAAAITLRLILPVSGLAGLSFAEGYLIAAWGCWTLNIVIAELIIRARPDPGPLPDRMVAARKDTLPA